MDRIMILWEDPGKGRKNDRQENRTAIRNKGYRDLYG